MTDKSSEDSQNHLADEREEEEYDRMREDFIRREEEKERADYEQSQIEQDQLYALAAEGKIGTEIGTHSTPKVGMRQPDAIMEISQPNSSSKKSNNRSNMKEEDDEGTLSIDQNPYREINNLMKVRVEELQSKMRSKRDMFHVLHSRCRHSLKFNLRLLGGERQCSAVPSVLRHRCRL